VGPHVGHQIHLRYRSHPLRRDEAQAQTIQGNRLYPNLRDALSGAQKYMAVEKLYQLHQEDRFDLIVVPWTSSAPLAT
jgi:anion-transporting  ArsA/GET3 family ATPase